MTDLYEAEPSDIARSGPPPRVRSRVWRPDAVIGEGPGIAGIAAAAGEDGVFWLDVARPDAALLAELSEAFHLDRNAIEDTVARGERPKARHSGSFMFVTVYATSILPEADQGPGTDTASDGDATALDSRLRSSRVSMFILRGGVITVRRDDTFDIDAAVARWSGNAAAGEGRYKLAHAILDAVVDGHLETAEQFDDALEDIEDRLFDDKAHDRAVQKANYRLRKELVNFRRMVLPMRDVITLIIRHHDDDGPRWSRQLSSDFADLYDHVLRVAELSESLRELVTTIFETNLSLQDARLNTVMKKLTGWAAIIAVPTAVTGWFGQNVPYPGSDEVSGLIGSSAAIIVLAIGLFMLFRYKDWI